MKSFASTSLVALALVSAAPHLQAKIAQATRPPLGWNSFNGFGVYLHEAAARENLEAMARLLQPYGYEYFVVDNGWFGEYRLRAGTLYPAEKHAGDMRLDGFGHVLPSKTYFPGGIEPLIERCHELGLKFGLHMMRGIPRKAYDLNLPIEGTPYTARDIACIDPKLNCKWCQYNYGVDMTKPGAQEWYDGLIRHLAAMGVDMLKFDDIVEYPDEVEAVVKAIAKLDRPILLSLSPGGMTDPAAIDTFRKGNMLRVTKDVWDEAHYIDDCFAAWKEWQGADSENFWIDMDMIPFGQLLLMSPKSEYQQHLDDPDFRLAGRGFRRWCQHSPEQMKTVVTLRAMAASPLMVGGDLSTIDGYSLRLLTDPDMLACNQNGVMGSLVREDGGLEVWKTAEHDLNDRGWVAVFNRGDLTQRVAISKSFLGLTQEGGVTVRDIWRGRKTFALSDSGSVEMEIRPDDVLFLRYEP